YRTRKDLGNASRGTGSVPEVQRGAGFQPARRRGRLETCPTTRPGRAGELGLDGAGQDALVRPARRDGGAVPALERGGADVPARLVVEHLEVRLREAAARLGRGAAEVDQAVAAVVEDSHGTPSLRLGFGLVEHDRDPRWSGENGSCSIPEKGSGGQGQPVGK